jgi:hypothetical protein
LSQRLTAPGGTSKSCNLFNVGPEKFAPYQCAGCPTQLSRMALEGSIIPIVEDMFKEGLAHHGMAPDADSSLPATTAAWTVFGAARRWFQTPNRVPAEEMAAKIETMVSPILFGASQ